MNLFDYYRGVPLTLSTKMGPDEVKQRTRDPL